MTHEQTSRIWTSKRFALALVVFALLAVALSSSCNNEANYGTTNNPRNHAATAIAAAAAAGRQQHAA
jgi:hypothetical protein